MRQIIRIVFSLLMIFQGIMVGCTQTETASAERVAYFETRGIIRSIDQNAHSITIQHDNVPGYMPAMTMPFEVSENNMIEGLQPGDRVLFRFRPLQEGRHVIILIRKL